MVPDFNLKSSSLKNPSWGAFELPLGHVSSSISENVEKSLSRDEISSGSIASFFSKFKELSEAHIQLLHQLVQNLVLEPGKIHSIPHARGVVLFLLAMERIAEEGCLDASLVPVLDGHDHLVLICEESIQASANSLVSQVGQVNKLACHLQDVPGIKANRHQQIVFAPWKRPPRP